MFSIILGIVVAIAVVGALVRFRPDWTLRWFQRIQLASRTIWTIVAISTAVVFLWTGIVYLQLIGIGIFAMLLLELWFNTSASELVRGG